MLGIFNYRRYFPKKGTINWKLRQVCVSKEDFIDLDPGAYTENIILLKNIGIGTVENAIHKD